MTLIKDDEVATLTCVKRTVVGIRCDICGKEIRADDADGKYYDVTTGNIGWPNSSCNYDICPDCIAEFTTGYLNAQKDKTYIRIYTKVPRPTVDYINIDDLGVEV